MKRFFCFILTILVAVNLFANEQGHFFMNVEDENILISQAESHFAQWLNLPANSTFALFRDTTDNLEIRHQSYQQFVNGTEVSNAMILIHSKNGLVFAINGDVMESSSAVQQVQTKITANEAILKVRKKINGVSSPLKIVRTTINGKTEYRYAYEVLSVDATSKQYVDAETGKIIFIKPLVYNADVEGTAMTMYYGTQPITCFEDDGTYYLRDTRRGIITLNATENYLDDNDKYELDGIYGMQDKPAASAKLLKFINRCPDITNVASTWGGSWLMLLESVKIENILQNSNWYSIGEGAADVYIKIIDSAGNVKFTSSRYDDPTFPVTFDVGIQVSTPPYYIEVWDYDPVSSDDLIETITIETIRGENKTYDLDDINAEIVELTFTINSLGRKPFFDAHWGMEKTIDFYHEKFNRNSFDNKGSVVYQLVNQPSAPLGILGSMYANACALGELDPCLMIYGMGVITSVSEKYANCINPLVAIDIVAHEFSHLVTEKNGNGGLVYRGESGALNESFSDIMGISVKQYATNSNDWLCGSDMMIYVSNLRSMSNPNNSSDGFAAQPDTYGGQYWVDITDIKDYGGVHFNSGVQNYWYYLLCEGGDGTNDLGNSFNVIGISIDKALQIAYRNLIFYLTPEATFEDARNGSIQAAIDLYGEDSQEHQSVVNAWYAVGVGEKFESHSENNDSMKYIILAQRKSTSNWYYLTSVNAGTEYTPHLEAVNSGTADRNKIKTSDLEDKYIWQIDTTTAGLLLKNGDEYVSYTKGNTAYMSTSGQLLQDSKTANDLVQYWFIDSNEITRYLSLNTNNDYFSFYTGTQAQNLLVIRYGVEMPITTQTNGLETESSCETYKILRDGQLLIKRGEKIYSITGARLQ